MKKCDELLAEMQRSFCINPLNPPTLQEILQEIPDAIRSPLSSRFFHCPSGTKINILNLYREGKIIPMELSSGLAVLLLDLQENDAFLDVCCAPGCKLVLAGLMIGKFGGNGIDAGGSCTGVDISRHRLCTAKSMVTKYKVPNVRLFLGDARKFVVPPHHSVGFNSDGLSFDELYTAPTRPFYSSSIYRKTRGYLALNAEYSKVLVDVECTHDGSIKHICKNGQPSIAQEQIAKLTEMQLEILNHAFSITKPGGTLIYSTCSLMSEQNEDVVNEFMRQHSNECRIVDDYSITDHSATSRSSNNSAADKFADNFALKQFQFTSFGNAFLKFDPYKDKVGGFFIAKIVKNGVNS